MLQPKRTKYRKAFKGRIHGAAKGGPTLELRRLRPEGDGAGAHDRAPDRGRSPRHHAPHEARRPRLDPRSSRTCRCRRSRPRSAWARGKGSPEFWVARVKPGRIMFELDGVPAQIAARGASTLAAAKLPIKTRFVARVGARARIKP